ncbi:DUF4190 domain-containing protein [Kitasatospora sp. NPDC057223]|uniref:DUF4190 domain-containing protein n=1 Tax=Kitasatospora sp. NPDC057223 TaxID=3346055 RepID=UPI00363B0B13
MSPNLSKAEPGVPEDGVPEPGAPEPAAAAPGPRPAAPEQFDPWAPPTGAPAGAATGAPAGAPAPPQAAGQPAWGAAPQPAGGAGPQAAWGAPPPTGWGAVTPGAVSGYQGPYAYPPQQTNGLAIASLVTSLTCIWPVGLVLGIVSLVQISKRRDRGRGMAVAGVLLSVLGMIFTLLLVIGIIADENGTAGGPTGGPWAPRGTSSWQDLTRGDCYNPAPGDDRDTEKVAWVAKVSCTLPHHSEVAGTVRIPAATDGGYPGESEIRRTADTLCAPVFSEYALDAWALPDGVSQAYLYPTKGLWKSSNTLLTCVFEDPDGTHSGSVRTDRAALSAAQLGYLEAVKPFNEAVDAMPLDDVEDAPEDYRVWAATMLKATQDEADRLAAVSWPAAAKGPADAMLAGKNDSLAAWQAAVAAADDAALDTAVNKAMRLVNRSSEDARDLRAALGLSTGEQAGDLQV